MENEELELGREVRITEKGDEREGQVGRISNRDGGDWIIRFSTEPSGSAYYTRNKFEVLPWRIPAMQGFEWVPQDEVPSPVGNWNGLYHMTCTGSVVNIEWAVGYAQPDLAKGFKSALRDSGNVLRPIKVEEPENGKPEPTHMVEGTITVNGKSYKFVPVEVVS